MYTFLHILNYPLLFLLALPINAQSQTPDQQGNYYKNNNETSVLAPSQANSRLAAGSLWKVVVNDLKCRRSASLSSPVVRTYQKNDLLEVEVYRGGSDEVFLNPLDQKGKPWMPVRGKNIEDVCFVRANRRYIAPVISQ